MSERAIRWAREMTVTPTGARLTGPEAQLLLFIATHHSEIDGAVRWPTIDEQRAFMRLQDRRVQWLNAQLEEKGCFRRDHRGGRSKPTTYELLMPVKGAVSGIAEEKGRSPDDTLYIEDDAKGASQTTPFIQPEKQKGAVKGAVSEVERVQSAVPDGEPKGGETLGVTGSTPSPSPSFPLVTSETTTAAVPKKAKKDKPAPDPRVRETMLRLQELQGEFAHYARDAAEVKKMLQRATPDQIIDCWKLVKAQKFWRSKPLAMATLNDNLTVYLKGDLKPEDERNERPATARTARPREPDPDDPYERRFGG